MSRRLALADDDDDDEGPSVWSRLPYCLPFVRLLRNTSARKRLGTDVTYGERVSHLTSLNGRGRPVSVLSNTIKGMQ
jgi:hypothetical protein